MSKKYPKEKLTPWDAPFEGENPIGYRLLQNQLQLRQGQIWPPEAGFAANMDPPREIESISYKPNFVSRLFNTWFIYVWYLAMIAFNIPGMMSGRAVSFAVSGFIVGILLATFLYRSNDKLQKQLDQSNQRLHQLEINRIIRRYDIEMRIQRETYERQIRSMRGM